DPLRGVLETAAEDDDLLLERLQLALEFADLALVLCEPALPVQRPARTSIAPRLRCSRTLHGALADPRASRGTGCRPGTARDLPCHDLRNAMAAGSVAPWRTPVVNTSGSPQHTPH